MVTNKLKNKKGGGLPILITFAVIMLFNVIFLSYTRDNRQYKWWLNNFKEGLRSGAKAALMQYDFEDDNFEYIAEGYLKGETEFNHFIHLNHDKANDIFFSMLEISTKNNYSKEELLEHTYIAIIEPIRKKSEDGFIDNSWEYSLTIYKNGDSIYSKTDISKDDFYNTQQIINSKTNKIKIDLTSSIYVNKLKPRTYYIAIVEDLPLKGLYMLSEKKYIDLYYFEGTNAVRSLDMRTDN